MPLKPRDPGARYRIVDEIASGGMGAVFVALRIDEDGKKDAVAIKKVHAHLVDDPSIAGSFVDEARIAFRLNHPNVVRVHDVAPIDGELVIVMDWIEGVPLRSLGRNPKEKLSIPVIRRILVDALEGLHAAHELKDDVGHPLDIVHRDISPQNLLVGTDGITRVTDFGIALARGRLAPTTIKGGVKGKLPYLSPEQVNRTALDRRSDIFAAGVVAWELLTQRRLFNAGTEGETLAMILREPILPPSSVRVDVPLDLDEVVLKALERKADRRYPTAHDLAVAIEAGGPLASYEDVGRVVVGVAGTSLAARRQKLAVAAQGGEDLRPLAVELTKTVATPTMTVIESLEPITVTPVSLTTGSRPPSSPGSSPKQITLPPPPPPPRNASVPPQVPTVRVNRSVPPPVPSARGERAIILDQSALAASIPPPADPVTTAPPFERSTTPLLIGVVLALGLAIIVVVKYTGHSTPEKVSFPDAPVVPPLDQRTDTTVAATPAPKPSATTIELAPTPNPTAVRPPHRPSTTHRSRDAGAPGKTGPFMPDDL